MATKTTDGKAGAKKAADKPAAKKAAGSKPNALQQPLQPSKELAAIVGSNPLPRCLTARGHRGADQPRDCTVSLA